MTAHSFAGTSSRTRLKCACAVSDGSTVDVPAGMELDLAPAAMAGHISNNNEPCETAGGN